jgi:hypothetical protein
LTLQAPPSIRIIRTAVAIHPFGGIEPLLRPQTPVSLLLTVDRVNSRKGTVMKRNLLALAALALVVCAAVIPSLASGSANAGRTIDLTGVMTSNTVVVDVKPVGYSAGDIGYVSGRLSEKGKLVGRHQGVCFDISADSSQCSFTAGLPRGQLLLAASYGPGYNTGKTALESITGGTGAFTGARGVAQDTEVGKTGLRMHIELLP